MYEALRLHGGASACCGGGGGGGCAAQSKSHSRNKGHERGNNIEDHVQNLCEQLSNIECEVRMMQDELTCKQNSQQDQTTCKVKCEDQSCTPAAPKKSARPCPPPPCPKAPQADCCESNLSELKEQYKRLQDDYKSKLCEVSQLRSNTDDLRRNAREAREERDRLEVQLCDALERIRNIEAERDRLLGCNEQMIEQEQALIIARQRFRETQDELEELRTMIRDQAEQLDEYAKRCKGKSATLMMPYNKLRAESDLCKVTSIFSKSRTVMFSERTIHPISLGVAKMINSSNQIVDQQMTHQPATTLVIVHTNIRDKT
ncbi:unnamed protein product [Trichogramma brassicae]|uniref:Uncharacterized protein n=1 Tax=Trichogramma brassicae TaxID=86971 RepID=A0A6H5I918_9HYME|nr:unnamed protein product [Trichogramma brassicae]